MSGKTTTLGLGAGVQDKPKTSPVSAPVASNTAPKPTTSASTTTSSKDSGKGGNRTRVFVYGTLKLGHCNNSALRGARMLGRYAISGKFVMLDVGWYPALVHSSTSEIRKIYGEVWEISEEHLAAMDLIEGHPTYFERVKVPTTWKGAWCYFLPEGHLKRKLNRVDAGVWEPLQPEQEWIDGQEKAV